MSILEDFLQKKTSSSCFVSGKNTPNALDILIYTATSRLDMDKGTMMDFSEKVKISDFPTVENHIKMM